ncbi:MAG: ATP-binding protein [Acidimicrobiia bacterium]
MKTQGGFRTRLVATFIGLIAGTVVILGVGSYLFVRSSLRGQLAEDAVQRTNFNLAVLATEWLDDDPTAAEYQAGPLADALALRGDVDVYVDFGDGDPFLSKPAFLTTRDLISDDLVEVVARGNIGQEWIEVDGAPFLVTAGRRPPSGPDFYFFYPATDIESGLERLRQALLAGGLVLISIGAVAGNWVARQVLRPVRRASEAALEMAEGDFTVRLDTSSGDEFGAWADAFNRMATSLQDTIGRLEDARARERRFVADVSHELRTPLTGLVNEAALIKAQLESMPGEGGRVAQLLVNDVTRMRRMVDDLLEISRLEAGAQEIRPERIDLREFLAAVIADRLPTARLLGGSETMPVEVDRRRLERIIGNLLENARVHAAGQDVEVSAEKDDGTAVVIVSDRGPGVDPADLDRLFDRFAVGDASRSGSGSGLGLAIALQHVEQMGGTLQAANRPGGGLTFEMRLPV